MAAASPNVAAASPEVAAASPEVAAASPKVDAAKFATEVYTLTIREEPGHYCIENLPRTVDLPHPNDAQGLYPPGVPVVRGPSHLAPRREFRTRAGSDAVLGERLALADPVIAEVLKTHDGIAAVGISVLELYLFGPVAHSVVMAACPCNLWDLCFVGLTVAEATAALSKLKDYLSKCWGEKLQTAYTSDAVAFISGLEHGPTIVRVVLHAYGNIPEVLQAHEIALFRGKLHMSPRGALAAVCCLTAVPKKKKRTLRRLEALTESFEAGLDMLLPEQPSLREPVEDIAFLNLRLDATGMYGMADALYPNLPGMNECGIDPDLVIGPKGRKLHLMRGFPFRYGDGEKIAMRNLAVASWDPTMMTALAPGDEFNLDPKRPYLGDAEVVAIRLRRLRDRQPYQPEFLKPYLNSKTFNAIASEPDTEWRVRLEERLKEYFDELRHGCVVRPQITGAVAP
jgi:hypothetical protein